MKNAELWFESGESTLSVRWFRVEEAMSAPFRVEVHAVSPDDNIDLEALVGRGAGFVLTQGIQNGRSTRRWTGICSEVELLRTDGDTGLSTYRLVIVPTLWLLARRRNNRLYQHRSIPDIVGSLLSEWRLPHRFAVIPEEHPQLELRTQFDESDLDLISRLLEETGISYHFVHEDERGSVMVLRDRPQDAEARPGLPFTDDPSLVRAGDGEFVTKVRLAREVRPGRVVTRDHDFRRPAFVLRGEEAADREQALEQYHYLQNAFLMERPLVPGASAALSATPIADDKAVARHDDAFGARVARRMLEGEQTGRRVVSFETANVDLGPGVCFSITGHPRRDLTGKKLLSVGATLEGEIATDKPWTIAVRAVLADAPYRPARITPRPRIYGLQSAVVVGPGSALPEGAEAAARAAAAMATGGVQASGDDVYVDEHGRVRVQFHWDREGRFDGSSSMWMRVSQAWAGGGYGIFTIPRVGHEVLVAFLDGDPDAPIIAGRVHNSASQAPYKLADNKTVSTWRTESTPGKNGFNELRFDDAAGREHVYVQAQKDMDKLVKNDLKESVGRDRVRYVQNNEVVGVGHNRRKVVKHNEVLVNGLNQSQVVGLNRVATVGVDDSTFVGGRWSVTVVRGLAPLVGKRLSHLFEGTLAPVLEGAATAVLGAVSAGPLGGLLGGAAQSALNDFKESTEAAFKNVLKVLEGFEAAAGPLPTTIEVVDRRIELTTGEASIILDGPNITLRAEGNIAIHGLGSTTVLAEQELALGGREQVALVSTTDNVVVQAGKDVHLNPYGPGQPAGEAIRLDHEFEPREPHPGTCGVCGGALTPEGLCAKVADGMHEAPVEARDEG